MSGLIERLSALSFDAFKSTYLKKKLPFVLRNVVSDTGLSKWENISDVEPSVNTHFDTIDSFTGTSTSLSWSEFPKQQKVMASAPLAQFSRLIRHLPQVEFVKAGLQGKSSLEELLVAKNACSELRREVFHAFMLCMTGSIEARLYSSTQSDLLYPSATCGSRRNLSEYRPDKPQSEQFPLMQYAKYDHVVVPRGEMLFVPKGYWSYWCADELSFVVRFLWI